MTDDLFDTKEVAGAKAPVTTTFGKKEVKGKTTKGTEVSITSKEFMTDGIAEGVLAAALSIVESMEEQEAKPAKVERAEPGKDDPVGALPNEEPEDKEDDNA